MNSDQEKLRALLDEVVPSSVQHCGPSSAELLHLLRTERQRRRMRTGAAVFALAAVALTSLFWRSEPPVVAPVAPAASKPAPLVIRNVDDEQFFALLQGTPTAMMEKPNGERTLLLIEH